MENVSALLTPKIRLEMFVKGQSLFNDEYFFEAHEEWEKLWHFESKSRNKIFVQALIQVVGHYLHLQKKNWSGGKSLGEAAYEKLQKPAPDLDGLYKKFDLEPILSSLTYNLKILNQEEPNSETSAEAFLFAKLFELS